MDKIEINGYWWLPGEKKKKIPGVLYSSSDNGLILDLNGNFSEEKIQDIRKLIILGEDSFGASLTLFQPMIISRTIPGTNSEKGISSFKINKVFRGGHFNKVEKIKFNRVAYEPFYLKEWVNQRNTKSQPIPDGFNFSYKLPEDEILYQDKAIKVSISFGYGTTQKKLSEYDFAFKEHAFFIIDCNTYKPFAFFTEIMSQLDNLLSLTSMLPNFPLRIDGYPIKSTSNSRLKMDSPIEILIPEIFSKEQEKIYFFEMLFTYKEINEKIPGFLGNWLSKKSIMGPIHDLFFTPLYSSQSNPVINFLNFVQALETYHSRRYSNVITPIESYRIIVRNIVSSVSKEYQKWLKHALSFWNTPYLALRLGELLSYYSYPVKTRHGATEQFIKTVRDTRNYYTHYDRRLEGKAAKGGYLKGLSITLGLLVEAFILRELGFDFSEIKKLQSKRKSYPFAWY
jgi:hypothetical protein